jgi:sugar phosphate isomerase/epimerase
MTALTASYWTLAGALPGQAPRFSFEERCAAAANAGFDGIGLVAADYMAMSNRGYSDDDIAAVPTSYDLRVVELEFVAGWSSDDEQSREQARRAERELYEVADVIGGVNLNVGCSEPLGALPPIERVAERFAALCDRARVHGLRVALEFMPWTAIADATTAWEVVRLANRDNGGILLDTWHYFRGAADAAQLRAIPPRRIFSLQINDGARELAGTLREDTSRRRRLPGEGDFDLTGLLRLLEEMGVDCPFAVEVMSEELAALPLAEAARRAFESTQAVLANARVSLPG